MPEDDPAAHHLRAGGEVTGVYEPSPSWRCSSRSPKASPRTGEHHERTGIPDRYENLTDLMSRSAYDLRQRRDMLTSVKAELDAIVPSRYRFSRARKRPPMLRLPS